MCFDAILRVALSSPLLRIGSLSPHVGARCSWLKAGLPSPLACVSLRQALTASVPVSGFTRTSAE